VYNHLLISFFKITKRSGNYDVRILTVYRQNNLDGWSPGSTVKQTNNLATQ